MWLGALPTALGAPGLRPRRFPLHRLPRFIDYTAQCCVPYAQTAAVASGPAFAKVLPAAQNEAVLGTGA